MIVPRETKLEAFVALLRGWGGTLNLTSHGDSDSQALQRHIDDSLSLLPMLPVGLTRLIDLGSGQGFPAIPIAIATGVTIDLIEADRRKAAFLTTVMARLGLAGHVHAARIETLQLPAAPCVTARALAPLAKLLDLARPFLLPDGCGLFLKGPNVEQEIVEANKQRSFDISVQDVPNSRSKLVKVTNLR